MRFDTNGKLWRRTYKEFHEKIVTRSKTKKKESRQNIVWRKRNNSYGQFKTMKRNSYCKTIENFWLNTKAFLPTNVTVRRKWKKRGKQGGHWEKFKGEEEK